MMHEEAVHAEINQWSDIERRHEVRLDGLDASNLLHQTRCTTYDQLQYNSKDSVESYIFRFAS
jgi:hypothetical protein